jgi:hypothetical protein
MMQEDQAASQMSWPECRSFDALAQARKIGGLTLMAHSEGAALPNHFRCFAPPCHSRFDHRASGQNPKFVEEATDQVKIAGVVARS